MIAETAGQVESVEQARRLSEGLREAGEHALHAVRKWADPRERELRRRRRVRRRSLRLSAASGVTALGTAGLVLISAPAWAVLVVGGGAAALVTGAAVTTKRYLELRRNPLPDPTFVPRKLPPVRSSAREPIARLVRAERALHVLGRRIAHGARLPEDDVADTLQTAHSGAAALHALAADIAAMEQAIGVVAQVNSISTPGLAEQVGHAVTRLEHGVVEYEQLVAAAGRVLAAPDAPAAPDDLGWALTNLRDAADRLDGWAQALTDLADRRRG
ncbi:phage shock envelope stress response protein PspM [Nocardia sp. NPDC003482]